MTPERWNAINRIFHAALEVEPEQRQTLVLEQSGGDPEIESEVHQLLLADEESGEYLDSPIAPSALMALQIPTVAVGDVLCNRFRIVRQLAEGGMGQVFEAFDTELAVRIALKVIRPELAASPEAIARFRQEVRLARTITHPGVCRTFDLDRDKLPQGEVIFLTMEFLPGETLAGRLQRDGGVPLDEALAHAHQIAGALEAAHTLGIVHRDMKPANIMLVPAESGTGPARTVITDFGLARLDPLSLDRLAEEQDGRSSLSHTGRPMGTLGYMAPEQLEGSPVSPATDIYAFALILYEMATGERLFKSVNLLTGIAQRLKESAPSVTRQAPHLPPNWLAAISAGLRLDPADRPASALDLLEILEGKRKPKSIRTPRRMTRTRALTYAALIFCATLSLFYAGLRYSGWKAESKVTPGALVYLAEVKNQTGERSLDATTELLRASLAQSAQVNLLDQGRVGDLLQQMKKNPETPIDGPIGREIAMRAGAARVVFAKITGSPGQYSLSLEVQEPDNTPSRYREHWKKTFAWESLSTGAGAISPELLAQVRAAGDWVRHEAGESANDIARLDTPPEDITTGDWNALSEYAAAQQSAAHGEIPGAIDRLQRAIQIDPHFALAQGRLGDLYAALRRWPESYSAYRQALAPDLDRHLTRRERDRIEGMYAVDTGDAQMAENAFRDYTLLYEYDPLGWSYRSYPLELLGKTEDAVASLQRANALTPHRSFPQTELAACYLLLGRYDDARQMILELRKDHFDAAAQLYQGQLQFLLGEYDQAEASLSKLTSSQTSSSRRRALAYIARVRAERNDSAGAIAALTEAISLAEANHQGEEQATYLLDRAMVWASQSSVAQTLDDISRATALDPSVRNLTAASTVLGVANASTQSVHAQEIVASLGRLASLLPPGKDYIDLELAHLHVQAETSLAQGDWRGALELSRKADALEPPTVNRDTLARAYLAAATHQTKPSSAEEMRRKALQAYEVIALRPANVWAHPLKSQPGLVARQLAGWLALADSLHMSKDQTARARALYAALRPQGVSRPSPQNAAMKKEHPLH